MPPSGDSRRAELQWQGPAERAGRPGARLCSRADRSVHPAAGGSLWRAHSAADAGVCCPRTWRNVCRCAHMPGRRVAGWVGQGWVEMGKCVQALGCIRDPSIGAGLRHPQLGTCQSCGTRAPIQRCTEELPELEALETELGIQPDPAVRMSLCLVWLQHEAHHGMDGGLCAAGVDNSAVMCICIAAPPADRQCDGGACSRQPQQPGGGCAAAHAGHGRVCRHIGRCCPC